MSLIDKIIRMIEARADIEIFDVAEAGEIWAVQLRRHWCQTILNEGGFNPVERLHYKYFGQTILIAEPKFNKKKELVKEQREMMTRYGRVGVEVIFATDLDTVIDNLGPEPPNVNEYLGRKEK